MLLSLLVGYYVHELMQYIDPSRLVMTCVTCVALATIVSQHLWAALGIAGAVLFIAAMVLFSKHSKVAIATPMVSIGRWMRQGRWSPFKWHFERKERAMREKDVIAETNDALVEEIVDYIESQRTSEMWSDVQCDLAYNKLRKSFPIFRHAIDNPTAVRAIIAAEVQQLREIRNKRRSPTTVTAGVVKRTRTAKA